MKSKAGRKPLKSIVESLGDKMPDNRMTKVNPYRIRNEVLKEMVKKTGFPSEEWTLNQTYEALDLAISKALNKSKAKADTWKANANTLTDMFADSEAHVRQLQIKLDEWITKVAERDRQIAESEAKIERLKAEIKALEAKEGYEIGKSHVDDNLKSALDLSKNRKTLNESLVSQLADMDRELLILKNSTICKGHGYTVKFCHRCLEDCLTEKDKELSKEAIKLKGIMQKSDMFRSDMVEENIRLKSERSELIKAVIESGSFQIKDLPYFNRLWAGAENGKLMPEATRKLYELEIIEKEKVLELSKGDKI